MANRRRDETQDDMGQAIFDAAVAVFARDGFEASRIDAIAKRAGVAKGSVYNHYADKEELFFSVVASEIDEMNRLLDDLNRAAGDEPFAGFTRRMVGAQYRRMIDRRGAGLVIFSDSWGRLREDLRRRIVERLRGHLLFVTDILAVRAGLAGIALPDPEKVATALLGLAFIFAQRRTLIDAFEFAPAADPIVTHRGLGYALREET